MTTSMMIVTQREKERERERELVHTNRVKGVVKMKIARNQGSSVEVSSELLSLFNELSPNAM